LIRKPAVGNAAPSIRKKASALRKYDVPAFIEAMREKGWEVKPYISTPNQKAGKVSIVLEELADLFLIGDQCSHAGIIVPLPKVILLSGMDYVAVWDTFAWPQSVERQVKPS
jgi:hypothetical protein